MPRFPTPLDAFPPARDTILATLTDRVRFDPFVAIATAVFFLAILHTFTASRLAAWGDRVQRRHDERRRTTGQPPAPSLTAEMLQLLGEVEVVFGLWAIVLVAAITMSVGWEAARHYVSNEVIYTEPMFVVVIMALASTRPIITAAEGALSQLAGLAGGTPAAWWCTILIVGPLLGSLITEPAAMTISAWLLARQFFDLNPSSRLKYATLGLLFVNVSIGGTLTHFAAPPILMVSRPWGWDTAFMLSHFGWRAAGAIIASTATYLFAFRRELSDLARRAPSADVDEPEDPTVGALLPVPPWLVVVHVLFIAWTVFTAHDAALFIGGFLVFLGVARATSAYQARIDLKSPLLVGFFLAGLVIHGGLQGWWIAPVLASLREEPLFLGATVLTAFNDNALITYLATLVPNMTDSLKAAVVQGAVTGGGLTVIANAPNPAGQALLGRFFGNSVSPLKLFLSALFPTLVAVVAFRAL